MHGHFLLFAACCGCFGLAGCASEDSPPDDAGSDDSDASAAAELFGYFNIKLEPMREATPIAMAMAAKTSVIGAFATGPTPSPYPWALAEEEGECKLLVPSQPHCDPSCGSRALCVTDDDGVAACLELPEPVGVGVLHVTGLSDPFDIERISGARNYQLAPGMTLPYPPCEEGEQIELEAEGDAFDSFELAAPCIAPMSFPGPIALEPGTPLQLIWQAPSAPDVARVLVEIDISHHGGSRGLIECEVDDSGSLEIAASLVDGLLDLGVAGFPSVTLTRFVKAHGSTAQATNVELTISSRFQNFLELPGLTSCTGDDQCEAGQTCQPDFRCE